MNSSRKGELSQPIPGYEILELLGSGGSSSVYRARHEKLGRFVAIKVLRREQIDPGLALARLMKEARVLSRLDHPGIVRSIDFGEAGDLVFFVLELVEGRSCKQLLIERGKLPLREVLLIGERVAEALGHAASHGVIHRDVKPGNILLAKDGSVKLSDFGLARATRDRSLTQDGITVGTPQYMSPEQVKSPRRVDLRSDFYSLGATLYHLATGEAPFRGDNVGEILHDVLYAAPRPPEQIDPSLPQSFSRLLARLLAKDAKRRYASALELIADLSRVRAELAGAAEDESVGLSWQEAAEPPPPRVKPWLFASAALVIAGVTGVALLHGRGERRDPVADARAHEEGLLAELGRQLDLGRQPPARVLARIGELKRDGTLTVASGLARVDLKARALAAFDAELESAAVAARSEAAELLRRADFAGAQRAFDAGFARRLALLAPGELQEALAAADVNVEESRRRLFARHAGELETLAQRVLREVRVRILRERDELADEMERLLADGRLNDARERLAGHVARERAACLAATRDALSTAGAAVAADVADDELARGWPENVRAEIEREPAASLVQVWRDELDFSIRRRQRDLLQSIRAAADADAALVAQGELDLEGARRREELAKEFEPQARTLAAVDALPAELDAEWAAYDAKVTETRARRLMDRQRAAVERLLDVEGKSGLVALLLARSVDAAQKALEGAEGLSTQDAAAWRESVADVAASLAAARAALVRAIGSEVKLRDQKGVAVTGRVAEGSNGTFMIGARERLHVEELDLDSLRPHVAPAGESEARRVAALFWLGDKKDHGALDLALDRLPSDPVVDVLRRVRGIEKMTDSKRREEREAKARTASNALDAAIEDQDAAAALAQWSTLQRYGDTVAGQAALARKGAIEEALAELKKSSRVRAALEAVAKNATERVVERDGSVRILYRFDRPDEGAAFGLAGNSVRVENGRLFFVGGDRGMDAREEGPVRRIPLDRRTAASLKVELYSPIEERHPPHFVALRLGAVCVGFFRPDEPQGETFEPELAGWFGGLNEFAAHFFDPALGESEPKKGKFATRGLERACRHVVEVRWLPDASGQGGTAEVWLDGERVYQLVGAMATPPESDGIELRSATALQVDSVEFRGRLKT